MQADRSVLMSLWFHALVIALIATALRLSDLWAHPEWDGLFHVLAASSWAESGTLRIADGTYDRAAAYTILIGELFRVFGESVFVARIPSLVSSVLTVLLLFFWTNQVAGRQAAWTAALCLALMSKSIELASFIRFYALHGLLFLCGAILTYYSFAGRTTPATRLLLAVSAAVTFFLAFYFQKTTLIGLASLAPWIAIQMASALSKRLSATKALLTLGSVFLLLTAVALLFLLRSGELASLYHSFSTAPLWAKVSENDLVYYAWRLVRSFPLLLLLFPVAIVVAVRTRPRFGSLCAFLFGIGIVLHSIAGPKHLRYIYYLMPFLFALWGVAIGPRIPDGIRWLRQTTGEAVSVLLPLEMPAWFRSLFVSGWLALISVFLVCSMPGLVSGVWYAFQANDRKAGWEEAAPLVRSMIQNSDLVLSTQPNASIYFYGRHDVQVSAVAGVYNYSGDEFQLDKRFGSRVIRTLDSMQALLDCYPNGVIISEWGIAESFLDGQDEVQSFISENLEEIDTGIDGGPVVYRWSSNQSVVPRKCYKPPLDFLRH